MSCLYRRDDGVEPSTLFESIITARALSTSPVGSIDAADPAGVTHVGKRTRSCDPDCDALLAVVDTQAGILTDAHVVTAGRDVISGLATHSGVAITGRVVKERVISHGCVIVGQVVIERQIAKRVILGAV